MCLSMIRNFFRGSSDSNISMYPVKGNCRFPNIMEQLANGRVESVIVEPDDYYMEGWKIGIIVREIEGEMHLIPFISYESDNYLKCRMGYFLGIKKSKCIEMTQIVLPSGGVAEGVSMKISNLKPEFLDDGALIIKYGIRVEAIQKANNIWHFQLFSDLFDSKGKQVLIQLWNDAAIRCHPQIAAIHHDKSIETMYSDGPSDIALQIAHGVRCEKSPLFVICNAIEAREMGFRNVVQYCQWQLIQNPFIWPQFISPFKIALENDMRSYLAHLIRELNSKEKLMKVLKEENIDKMSGESMKTFMKFLIYE